MDFNLSEERNLLAQTAGRFFARAGGARALIDNKADNDAFWQAASGLGLVEALLPAEAGGLGGTAVDLMLIFELTGKHLISAPFLSTAILGAMPLWLSGAAENQSLLAGVAAGRTRLALAAAEAEARYDLSQVDTHAERQPDGSFLLSGHKAVVLDGGRADYLLVTAKLAADSPDIAIFAVDTRAQGLRIRSYATIDGFQAADIWLEECTGRLVTDRGGPILEQTEAAGALCVSAQAVGMMEVMKDTTIDYVKTRKQFGRSIGSFQVIQHRLVDMMMEIEQARSAVMLAASRLDSEPDERDRAISAAKSLTGRTGKMVAEEAVQLHGGIAMCWETEIAHYAKRLVMADHLLGDSDYHLQRVMRLSR